MASLGSPNQFLWLDVECGGDLLDRNVTEVVARPERQQDVTKRLVLQPQVLVLSRHNRVAHALQKPSHLARANRGKREAFLLTHCWKYAPMP